MTYTKGPWWSVKSENGWSVRTYRDKSDMSPDKEEKIKWPYGATICSSVGDHTENRTRGNEEENATLIAAAPDLLEALEISLKAMEHMGDVLNNMDAVTEDDEVHFAAFEKARAAIAKARGR